MKKILIILLLIVGCYNSTEPTESNPSIYEPYANEHWDFGRWVHDYYKWSEYIEGDSTWNSLRELFINLSDSVTGCAQDPTMGQCYIDIWDHSHKVEFAYDGSIMSSSSEEFKHVFKDLCTIYYFRFFLDLCTIYDDL